jgi:twitching motility protein PilT
MQIDSLIRMAIEQGASDLHLEPGLPAALRIRGSLRTTGEPIPAGVSQALARELIGEAQWPQFLERRSFDLSATLQGVRCRINILQSSRGIGLAIRLLASFQATIEKLNLHPSLKSFVNHPNGLILVSGPTGCGKSSTLAALIQEINLSEARHIVTIESPIEYAFRPRRAFIRQREVGRDTPSFQQALLDAMREDPDVLMVGEMREPETMRLTLNAAETGHLVLATVHSSSCAEALQRVVGAFPSEIQNSVAGQLADCLMGVICQRLRFRPDLGIRVPECEVLVANTPVKAFIRNRDFFKIPSALETGADHGMWTFDRYRRWMKERADWIIIPPDVEAPDSSPLEGGEKPTLPPLTAALKSPAASKAAPPRRPNPASDSGPIEIEPVEGGLEGLIKKLAKPE